MTCASSPRLKGVVTALAACFVALSTASPQDTKDTRLLAQPAVSSSHVAFVYAEDLWICTLDGQGVRRLTSHEGVESNPRFSPDGRTLAFSADYDGNRDVYVVSVDGGNPRRLTWHPGADSVQDFTPDGRSILFSSAREVYSNRHQQLFEVSIAGGHPTKIPIPHAFKATYSPDGSQIAYVPLYEAFNQWKNYRGGTYSRIWIYDRQSHEVVEIPQPSRCNDTDPMWIGNRVYFRSDRDGEFNLFAYDTTSKKVESLTQHDDFPILNASSGERLIAYEQAGYLHLFDTSSKDANRMMIGVATDLAETRSRFASGSRWLRGASISPSGARAAVAFRGEILTLPAKKGDPRNLTHTPGAHEHSPAWSPDGKWVAFFSDESGEYGLHVVRQGGDGGVRKFELIGAGFYDSPQWSPDSKKICFSDCSWTLRWIDIETGDVQKIDTEPIYGPMKTQSHSWSPDSNWIAYTRITETYFQRVFLYSLEEKRSYPITDGLSDVGEPVFDRSGDLLYMTASTDAGPVRQWFAMSNADMEMSNSLYVAVLRDGVESPLKRESDEEKVEDEAPKEEKKSPPEGEGEEAPKGFDLDQIHHRILSVPTGGGFYSNLVAGGKGQVYYLKSDRGGSLFAGGSATNLYRYDFKKRKEELLASGVGGFSMTPDAKKILLSARGGLSIAAAGPGINPSSGRLAIDSIQVKIEPREEWKQIYHEAWRINRDYFYDPGMHGADWPSMRDKYEVFLRHCAVRSDLNRVIQWLCSELAVGHHRVGGGDRLKRTNRVSGGLLGADFEVDSGRYRLKKVYGGLNWNPGLRSPLTEPGVDVQSGDYLLAVNGQDLKAPDNVYRLFENTAGKTVRLTIAKDAEGKDSRVVSVEPLSNESALRNRDWVEGNLRRVTEATDGRVAYVYVPNTSTFGHMYFKRYFFPQADREAIIVDERHNGGGQVADYYIDILRRPRLCQWATRYGGDLKTPLSSIQGPKVMLIDETAGSGGDLLPWMFRELKLGPLVGRPTWGGLVGMLGFPTLMDGAGVTAPNLAIWTEDGFIVENVGVPPDVEVEQLPKHVIAGRDPQLEKAIEMILEELEKNPPKKPVRPPFPIRVRR